MLLAFRFLLAALLAFVLVCLWPAGGWGTLPGRKTHSKVQYTDIRNSSSLSTDLPPCTFEQLAGTFPRKRVLRDDKEDDSLEKCWSLKEQILRVPATAIQNRENLTFLGNGHMGTVYKVILELSTSTVMPKGSDDLNDRKQQCIAAVKTERCIWKTHHEDGNVTTERGSCLDPRATKRATALMATEYTGALLYYAMKQKKAMNETGVHDFTKYGFLPTWGVMYDRESHIITSEHDAYHATHTDPSILGVIMPYVPFTPLSEDYMKNLGLSTSELASMFLEVARHFVLRMDLGILHRDVQMNNFGLTADNGPAFLFDNSFAAVHYDSTTQACGEPCRFCFEDDFVRGLDITTSKVPNADLSDFKRKLARQVFPYATDRQDLLIERISSSKLSAVELVQLLEEFISV